MVVCSGALITFEIQKDKKLSEVSKKVETTGKAGMFLCVRCLTNLVVTLIY